MLDRIAALREEAEAAIAAAPDSAALEELRVKHLGRKADLPNLLRGVAELPPEERGRVGKAANVARRELEDAIAVRHAELERGELEDAMAARHAELERAEHEQHLVEDRVDVTRPGAPPQPVGRHHLITQTW